MMDCAVMAITPVIRYTRTPWGNGCIRIDEPTVGGEEVRTAGKLAMNGTEMYETALNKLKTCSV